MRWPVGVAQVLSFVVICHAQAEEEAKRESRPSNAEPGITAHDFVEPEHFDGEHQEPEFTAAQLEKLHGHADRDKDGRLSVAEAVAHAKKVEVAQAFEDVERSRDELDKNGDKAVAFDEYLAEVKAEAGRLDEKQAKKFEEVERSKFDAADANGDGLLHKEEITALVFPEVHAEVLAIEVRESLRKMDQNGDGKLNINEFFHLTPKDEPEIWLTPKRRAEFAKLDDDQDGHLGLEELGHYESGTFHATETMRDLFALADHDADGHLTAAELAAAKDKIPTLEARYRLKEWVEHHEL